MNKGTLRAWAKRNYLYIADADELHFLLEQRSSYARVNFKVPQLLLQTRDANKFQESLNQLLTDHYASICSGVGNSDGLLNLDSKQVRVRRKIRHRVIQAWFDEFLVYRRTNKEKLYA